MQALDMNGNGSIDLAEWKEAFEPAIEEMEQMTGDFFRDVENVSEIRSVRFDLDTVIRRTFADLIYASHEQDKALGLQVRDRSPCTPSYDTRNGRCLLPPPNICPLPIIDTD